MSIFIKLAMALNLFAVAIADADLGVGSVEAATEASLAVDAIIVAIHHSSDAVKEQFKAMNDVPANSLLFCLNERYLALFN